MSAPRRCPVVLAVYLASLSVPSGAAQEPRGPSPAIGAAIVLPHHVIAGQRATLAVLDAAGRLAPGVAVEFSGGERLTTDTAGRAAFVAPAEPGVLLVRLPGRGVNASTTVIAPAQNPPDGVQIIDYPRVIAVADRFAIDGSGFRGDAEENRVTLGDQPALVLAASPDSMVVLPGPRAAGAAQLQIEVGGRSPGPVPITLVALRILRPEKPLTRGEPATLWVHVAGTDQRLVLEVRNLTPDVIELPRGDVQRMVTSGGRQNQAAIELRGLRAGDYAVSARLVPGAYGLPDMESVREQLIAAKKAATGGWLERIDRLIHRIERDPQDVAKIRDELEKMMSARPEGELGRRIEAAWRELLKR